jgi:hypothetical protein
VLPAAANTNGGDAGEAGPNLRQLVTYTDLLCPGFAGGITGGFLASNDLDPAGINGGSIA